MLSGLPRPADIGTLAPEPRENLSGVLWNCRAGRFVDAPSPASQAAAADASGEGVTLNLVNVPAPQAAKTVLGDILGVKYTVDPT
jgi:hypothetical protein